MQVLDPNIIGRVLAQPYSIWERASSRASQPLRGRPRRQLTDIRASNIADVTIKMTADQFASWQQFWTDYIGRGTEPFYMILDLSGGLLQYPVLANSPWSASMNKSVWTVSLRVEIPYGYGIPPDICDVILGYLNSDDIIYGGPLNDLSGDDIAPCPEVLGNV